jgi:hypothetical protein
MERTNQQHANQFVDHKQQCFVLYLRPLIGSLGRCVSFRIIIERCSDVNSGVITH